MTNTESFTKKMGEPITLNQHTNRKSVVTVNHLRKLYGTTIAADDVSFEVGEGEIFGIIGPNGAGKTTTVECISGLRIPDSGSATIYGFNPVRARTTRQEQETYKKRAKKCRGWDLNPRTPAR